MERQAKPASRATATTAVVPDPPTSAEVRRQLIDSLRLDLVGPWQGHEFAQERLRDAGPGTRPSQWYLTGFIVPSGERPKPEAVAEASDEAVDAIGHQAPPGEEATDEGMTARKGYFPSSIGLSLRIDPETPSLESHLAWGDYTQETVTSPGAAKSTKVWTRIPGEACVSIDVP